MFEDWIVKNLKMFNQASAHLSLVIKYSYIMSEFQNRKVIYTVIPIHFIRIAISRVSSYVCSSSKN